MSASNTKPSPADRTERHYRYWDYLPTDGGDHMITLLGKGEHAAGKDLFLTLRLFSQAFRQASMDFVTAVAFAADPFCPGGFLFFFFLFFLDSAKG